MQKIRGVANYQFEASVGSVLFPDGVELVYSRKTGRIRRVYFEGRLLATLRPRDGLFSLTIFGVERLKPVLELLKRRVVVRKDMEEFVRRGQNVFARHVVEADEEIRPGSEAIVVGENGEVLAVGRAVLSGAEMLAFKRGIAVKVRKGTREVGLNEEDKFPPSEETHEPDGNEG